LLSKTSIYEQDQVLVFESTLYLRVIHIIPCFTPCSSGKRNQPQYPSSPRIVTSGCGKAMHELDYSYSSRSLMQLCKTRHPRRSIRRGYLIASALLP